MVRNVAAVNGRVANAATRSSPKTIKKSNSSGSINGNFQSGRSHSGQSTLPSSPNNGSSGPNHGDTWLQIQKYFHENDGKLSIPGSANSTTKSLNGSIRSSNDDDIDGDNINVVIRVRPLNAKEMKNDDVSILQFPGDGGIWVDEQKSDHKLKPFTFNVVFEPEASQEDILEHSGIKRLIEMAVDGFSTTAFCYGQTGSGKTHTLTGPPHLFQSKRMDPLHPDHGLVLRSLIHLFEEIKSRNGEATHVIKASYLEIYNEKVIDLLNPGTKRSNLNVRWDKKSRAFVVDNLFSIECQELDDLVAVLEEGLKNRAIGTHNMNEHSSRSHTILTVHIHSEEKASTEDNKGVYITRHGKINFVDLAGSEMTKKTKSEGKTLEEANNINKSLMVLGYCIAQLSSQKKQQIGVHIPYRDSKLTKLLADSLAGNGVTLMIACVSPAKSNLSETSNTLRYAARAKKIKTKPVVVMDPREALIVSLKREVNILQQENNHLRQLLELADSDSGISFPQESSAAILAQMGMDKNGHNQPLDGRESPASNDGSSLTYFRNYSQHSHYGAGPGGGAGQGAGGMEPASPVASRPASQRSHDTLRQVSSLLFIATPATSKRIDKTRLNELDSSTLVDLIKDYMSENQDLRKENGDLYAVKDMLLRDQELVCRENERLLKKLEDVTSVCCRSPIVPVRPTYSAELLTASFNGSLPRSAEATGSAPDLSHSHSHGTSDSAGAAGGLHSRSDSRSSPVTNVWTNPLLSDSSSSQHPYHHQHASNSAVDTNGHGSPHGAKLTPSHSSLSLNGSSTPIQGGAGSKPPHRLPPNINKELEKRKIGNSLTNINIADSIRDKSNRGSGSKESKGLNGRKGSGESEVSPDELFNAMNNRKKPGQLADKISMHSEDTNLKRGFRKERSKKLREKSRSKERLRGDASKF